VAPGRPTSRRPVLTPPHHHILQDDGCESTDSNPVPRQKDVRRDVRRRDRGQRPQLQKTPASRIRNHQSGGQAATVAGDVGPGFHTWPPGHIPQNTDTNPLPRSRPSAPAQKDVRRDVRRRDRGQRPQLQKTPASRIRNHHAGGQAATVAGDVGPGFHTWPPGHIPQNTDPNPLPRSRASTPAQKSSGETFGAATGVSAPSYRRNRGPSATSFKTRIRIH
jgi:hypothetical protein